MMALWEEENVSISQLAKRTGLSKSTLTPLLRRLQEKGFIVLKRIPNNERQKDVVLTQLGKDLSLQSVKVTEEAFCATGLSEKQANDLISLCHRITKYSTS